MATPAKKTTTPAKPKTPSNAELQARYGYAISFFNSNPELKTVLANARKNNWDVANFQAAIRNTKWWKARSDAQRQYDTDKANNPAQAARTVAIAKESLAKQAASMGVTVDDAWLNTQAAAIARNGSSPDEVQSVIAAKWWQTFKGTSAQISDTTQTGQAAATVGDLRAMAKAYGYPMADDTLERQTYDVLNGHTTTDALQETYRTWAKKQFAGVADLIDAGQTVEQILDPYATIASQELGISKDQIKATDPKWQRALNGAQGGAMSLTDFRTALRQDGTYGYNQSQSAQEQAYGLVSSLRRTFGGG